LRFHGDCGDAFQANIDFALESLRRLGIKIVDAGEAISEEEARRRGML
jgi:hypothetical protein